MHTKLLEEIMLSKISLTISTINFIYFSAYFFTIKPTNILPLKITSRYVYNCSFNAHPWTGGKK